MAKKKKNVQTSLIIEESVRMSMIKKTTNACENMGNEAL
jgi:hypothetical protein